MTPTVGVVVLAWRDEPYLAECVAAVRASEGVDVRLVVVDNGCPRGPPADVGARSGRAATPASRAAATSAPPRSTPSTSRCVNSDCVIAPDTLAKLVAEASAPASGR